MLHMSDEFIDLFNGLLNGYFDVGCSSTWDGVVYKRQKSHGTSNFYREKQGRRG